jgi:hypothetical protein
LQYLARLPHLQHLNLGGCRQITDRGLAVLRRLPELRTFQLWHQGNISDAGIANLAGCMRLEKVNVMGTQTGDGAIAALAGKPGLRQFYGGSLITDAGLALFHQFPIFKTWREAEPVMALMSADVQPNLLWLNLKAPFTDSGLANLAGLEGLYALNLFGGTSGAFDASGSAVTSAGLAHLAGLSNLRWLGCTSLLATDEALRQISAMPRLRFLMAQDAVAGDDGFASLSRSQSIEYIWGRRCHNLTGRGFAALAAMPALRGLSLSCKNVDDAGLSALPRFPALREFMPMDIPDAGFRHVGECERLESLICMYCDDTTDVATSHIASLPNLKNYEAWSTKITDRSLEVLGAIPSLERVLVYNCAGVTDTGVRSLARLPRLREVVLSALPNLTQQGTTSFPANVRIDITTE